LLRALGKPAPHHERQCQSKVRLQPHGIELAQKDNPKWPIGRSSPARLSPIDE
jgi:hypothetical protein